MVPGEGLDPPSPVQSLATEDKTHKALADQGFLKPSITLMCGGITVKVHNISIRIADGRQTTERSRAGLQLDGNPYLAQLRNSPIDIVHLKGHRRVSGHDLEALLLMNCEVNSVQKACPVKFGAVAFFLQRDPQPVPIEADECFGIGRIHQDRIQSLGFHPSPPDSVESISPRRQSSHRFSRDA